MVYAASINTDINSLYLRFWYFL